jgi:hypothetical protein
MLADENDSCLETPWMDNLSQTVCVALMRSTACRVCYIAKVGSDHCLIVLDSGDGSSIRNKYFSFENSWLLQAGFKDLVCEK